MACLAFLLGCAALFYNKSSASISKFCHGGFVVFILITFILNVATFGGIGGGTNPIQNHENWYYILGNSGWPEAYPGAFGTGGQCAVPAGAVSSSSKSSDSSFVAVAVVVVVVVVVVCLWLS